MEQKAVVQMLAILGEAYPKLLEKKSAERLEASVKLWHMMLEPYPEPVVMHVMRLHLRESVFPPTPADLIRRIDALRGLDGDDADALWNKLAKAASRGYYNAQEEFEALPYACQRFVGSKEGLRALALMEEETLHTVTRGQFMRRVEVLRETERMLLETPKEIRAMIEGFSGALALTGGMGGAE